MTPKFRPAALSDLQRTVAVLSLIGYAVFTWWMIKETSAEETTWTRLIFVYQGVEALVFAAAGLMFGHSVQRARVDAAEKETEGARSAKAEAEEQAAVGRALESAIRAASELRASAADSDDVPPARSGQVGRAAGAPSVASATLSQAEFAQYLTRIADEARKLPPASSKYRIRSGPA